MENTLVHEFELYPPETFKALLSHEVNRSHRYGDSLTLVHLTVEAKPASPENQHSAEVLAIDALNVHLRTSDIPCKQSNEFQILMPATGAQGAFIACERLRKLITTQSQSNGKLAFDMHVFMGMATLPNNDRSVSSDKLAQNAAQALEHARANQLTSVVRFSELVK